MMGELGKDWLRGVGVTVPVTGGGGNNQAWPLCWPLVSSKIRRGGREEGERGLHDAMGPTTVHICVEETKNQPDTKLRTT
jgi:hypothetical protein